MTTYHSYRSAVIQKKVLLSCIDMITRANAGLQSTATTNSSIWKVYEELHDLLIDSDLSNVDVDLVLDELIAASHNTEGFIPERRAKELEKFLYILLSKIKAHISDKQPDDAWRILSALLSNFAPAYWRVTDISAFRPVFEAFGIVESLADNGLFDGFNETIFEFLTNQYQQATDSGRTNIKIEWLYSMAYHARNEGHREMVTTLCAGYRSPFTSQPQIIKLLGDETLQVLHIMFIRSKSPATVREFLHANLHDDNIRKSAIDLAIENTEWRTATDLCYDRIAKGEKTEKDLYDWYDLLLEASEAAHDIASIKFAAGWLFRHMEDFKYYKILKMHTPEYEWSQQWEELIGHLRIGKNAGLILEIYMEENDEKGAEMILPELGVRSWLQYEQQLVQRFPVLVRRHFDMPVWTHLKWKTPGITDGDIMNYLLRMRKRFGKQRSEAITALLRACYPRREALHEILNELEAS